MMSNNKKTEKTFNKQGIIAGYNKLFSNRDSEVTSYLKAKKRKKNKINNPQPVIAVSMGHLTDDLYTLDINNFSDNLKDFIQKVERIPSIEYKEKIKRENIKARRHFKYFSKVILLIIKSLLTRRKYFQESWFKSIDYDSNMYLLVNNQTRSSSILEAYQSKSLLTKESLSALNTPNESRNEFVIKKIIGILTRFNVLNMVIPRDSIIELAKRVKYQKLENARVIGYEGQVVQNLYYVLSGKINCVKKFDLSDGDLYKIVNTLNKGQHTDPDEVEKKLKRSYLMYSKGVTEVLILSAKDLEALRYNSYHLPIEFISSLNLFKSYPVESLANSAENIYYKFFGPNEIISQDSENSPWIYVVISGYVKVVKKMKLVNSCRSNQEKDIFTFEETESIRNAESSLSEYANEDVIDLRNFQISDNFTSTKEIKLERDLTLPQINYSSDKIINRQSNVYLSASIRRETPSQSVLLKDLLDDNSQFVKSEYEILDKKKLKDNKINFKRSSLTKSAQNRHIRLKETSYRLTYVVVDKIQKGDIFGLYPLIGEEKTKIQNLSKKNFDFNHTKSAEDRSNIILISEGAELVMINKVSFFQYADVLTLCKIEQLEKSDGKYITEQQAREQFLKLDKWREYKKKLFKSIVNFYN